MAEITIEFPSVIQANCFAIMCESGQIGTLINDYLDGIGLDEDPLQPEGEVDMDMDDLGNHEITFIKDDDDD